MPTVRRSVIVPHSCTRMFELVDEVERYPEFLPWCPSTRVIARDAKTTHARIDIDFHGLKSSFETRNAKHPPTRMKLELVDGPFEEFAGEWRFAPLGKEGCRVELAVDYRLTGKALGALLGPAFGVILESLVERFVERAEALESGR